ncbi:MAG: hypothetical protein SVY53_01070 [Chloroflexota bacterium]|nr:hypothetical protein [Chloroflexota bacterium]
MFERRIMKTSGFRCVKWLSLVFAVLLMSTSIAYAMQSWTWTSRSSITLVSSGEVEGIGVYWDESCTNPVTYVQFGNVEIASPENYKEIAPVYFCNEGDVPIEYNDCQSAWTSEQRGDDGKPWIVIKPIFNDLDVVIECGEVKEGAFVATVSEEADLGVYDFVLEIVGITLA